MIEFNTSFVHPAVNDAWRGLLGQLGADVRKIPPVIMDYVNESLAGTAELVYHVFY
jgi:hypothetical protein